MSSMRFNPINYANKLKRAGVEDKAAETIAEEQQEIIHNIYNEQIATRNDILKIHNSLKDTEVKLSNKITESSWKVISIIGGSQAMMLGVFGVIQTFLTH